MTLKNGGFCVFGVGVLTNWYVFFEILWGSWLPNFLKMQATKTHQESQHPQPRTMQNYWIHGTLRRDAAGSLARLGALRSSRSTRSRTSKSSRSRKSRSSHGSHDDPERLIIGKITAGMVVGSERTSQYCILPTIVAFFSEHVFKIF